MRAIVITEPGAPAVLRFGEVENPEPGKGELLIRVQATALNRADLLQRRGLYPPPAGTRPDVPGLEFCGVVESSHDPFSSFRKGDRVMGLLPGAGYAERVAIPAGMALAVPANLTDEQAASIPEAFFTAYDALFRQLGLRCGQSLLIHAVGAGVGTAALQLANLAGVVTIGTSRSEAKLERAKELGLAYGICTKANSSFLEKVRNVTRGEGVDAILDLVGAAYFSENLSALREQGRLLVVGLVSGNSAEANLGTLLRRRIHIIGTALRPRPLDEKITLTREFGDRILPFFVSGQLVPVIDRIFDWAEAVAAHSYMEENRNFGKVVLRVTGPIRA